MGYYLKTSCNECGYTKNFRLGHGRFDHLMERILPQLEKNDALEIEKLQKNNTLDFVLFDIALAYCSNCNELFEVPIASIFLKNGQTIKNIKCPSCKKDITIVDETEEKILCPKCGNSSLICEELGLWD